MSTSTFSFVNIENYKKRSPNVALSYLPGTKSCWGGNGHFPGNILFRRVICTPGHVISLVLSVCVTSWEAFRLFSVSEIIYMRSELSIS